MSTGRLEAFSDGVLAIIITITVLTMSAPDGADWNDLSSLVPKLLSYILSFMFIGINWNSHHHLMSVTERVSGGVLWANLLWLFWLSLIPITTDWIGNHVLESVPSFAYGFVILMAALSYKLLTHLIKKVNGVESVITMALANDIKERITIGLCLIALVMALVQPAISYALYVVVPLVWLIPDRRMERASNRTAE